MKRFDRTVFGIGLALGLAACGDDSATGGSAAGGGDEGGNSTQGGGSEAGSNPGGASEGGTGEGGGGEGGTTGLTPRDLKGTWSSAACEAYPDGNGGMSYLTRSFTFDGSAWSLALAVFGDDVCRVPLFTADIEGSYAIGAVSAIVPAAHEADFGFDTNVWTAANEQMAGVFDGAGCGSAPWEVGVPQSVADTGCIGVAHAIADCPTEFDLLSLDGDDLYFGARVTDLCTETGRPTMLGPFPVTKR